MPKLNDTQTILLSAASRRDDASLYPLPTTLSAGPRATKAVAALVKAGFAEERETQDATLTCRTDGDRSFGVFITTAGLDAIGVAPDTSDGAAPPTPAPISKRDTVLALLSRDGGATMAELIAATGWLPHTTRAALTGLRKKGHAVVRGKRGEESCYSVAAA